MEKPTKGSRLDPKGVSYSWIEWSTQIHIRKLYSLQIMKIMVWLIQFNKDQTAKVSSDTLNLSICKANDTNLKKYNDFSLKIKTKLPRPLLIAFFRCMQDVLISVLQLACFI